MGCISFKSSPYKPIPVEESEQLRVDELADQTNCVLQLNNALWRNAVLLWFVLPPTIGIVTLVWVVNVSLFPADWSLAMLGFVLFHHIYVENKAWFAIKNIITGPERVVMRQNGVLGQRRCHVLLGVSVVLDMYTDLTFPIMAYTNDEVVTYRWTQAWREVPQLGSTMVPVFNVIRFWGFAASLNVLNVLVVGFGGLFFMLSQRKSLSAEVVLRPSGVSGTTFLAWAKAAEIAAMPSVANFCQAMADQKKYIYDDNKDAAFAAEIRFNAALGHCDFDDALKQEAVILEEIDRINADENVYFIGFVMLRVFTGNLLQLWSQTSFFTLAFDHLSRMSKLKLMISMSLSSMQAILRSLEVVRHVGLLSAIPAFFALAFLSLIGAKTYFAFKCADHVWNFTTGCVDISNIADV